MLLSIKTHSHRQDVTSGLIELQRQNTRLGAGFFHVLGQVAYFLMVKGVSVCLFMYSFEVDVSGVLGVVPATPGHVICL